MTINSSSQRALHAVRLVLRDFSPIQTARREFSVAVLPNYPSSTTTTLPLKTLSTKSTFWDPRHASSDIPTSPDFLESPSSEYTSASLTLPSRQISPTAHWAQIYPSSSPSFFHPTTPGRRCDTLALLASTGDLTIARTVYDELSALHIGIQRREIYLTAALTALNCSTEGKEGFSFWLELVPNRPAVRGHPGLKSIWNPVIDRIISEFPTDKVFINDFLTLAAKKGILPVVSSRLIRHLALITPVTVLKEMMDELEAVYMAGTTARESSSTRAVVHAYFARIRVDEMWNSFVRALSAAGWHEEAAKMLEDETRVWTADTREYVDLKAGKQEGYVSAEGTPRIVRHVKAAINGRMSPKNLVELIDKLEQEHRGRLLGLLERRIMTIGDESRKETWFHAQILIARRNGASNPTILEMFNKNFVWLGIPSTPLSNSSTSGTTTAKLIPSSHIFTTILPSLLPLLPDPASFYQSYLTHTRSLSPRLQPTSVTHYIFLRHITHTLGPSAGLVALKQMIDAGVQPVVGPFNAVLWSMAGRGEWDGVKSLLEGMENGAEIAQGAKMPMPEVGTYKGIAGILDRAGMVIQAEEIQVKADKLMDAEAKLKAAILNLEVENKEKTVWEMRMEMRAIKQRKKAWAVNRRRVRNRKLEEASLPYMEQNYIPVVDKVKERVVAMA